MSAQGSWPSFQHSVVNIYGLGSKLMMSLEFWSGSWVQSSQIRLVPGVQGVPATDFLFKLTSMNFFVFLGTPPKP